jgi:hypothetical protein
MVPATALGVLNVTRAHTCGEVVKLVCAHRQSVGVWVRCYGAKGATGFAVAPGLGQPAQVDG